MRTSQRFLEVSCLSTFDLVSHVDAYVSFTLPADTHKVRTAIGARGTEVDTKKVRTAIGVCGTEVDTKKARTAIGVCGTEACRNQ